MKTKEFHISDILSVTTDRLVSNRGMDGVYDILKFMTQTDVYTIQIPRAIATCGPVILSKYPQLEKVDMSGMKENPEKWVKIQEDKYGEYLSIDTIPDDTYKDRDIVEEMSEVFKTRELDMGN